MAVSALDIAGVARGIGKDVSGAIGGTSVTGWTGGEVVAISMLGTGLGAGAMTSVAPACVAPASGAGKASEGMAVMLAGGSVLGDIEACDGLGFGLALAALAAGSAITGTGTMRVCKGPNFCGSA